MNDPGAQCRLGNLHLHGRDRHNRYVLAGLLIPRPGGDQRVLHDFGYRILLRMVLSGRNRSASTFQPDGEMVWK